MWEPVTSAEREIYTDDSGNVVTLRSIPQRKYRFETLPIPSYFAEKLQLLFSCSDITMNKMQVNADELPEIEIISETNLCVVTGEVSLKEFNDDYYQNEEIQTVSEQLTSWTAESNVVLLDAEGKEILAWFHDDEASSDFRVNSNTFNLSENDQLNIIFNIKNYNDGYVRMNDQRILMSHDFISLDDDYINSDNIELEIWDDTASEEKASFELTHGLNYVTYTAPGDSSYRIRLRGVVGSDQIFLTISPSVLKIS